MLCTWRSREGPLIPKLLFFLLSLKSRKDALGTSRLSTFGSSLRRSRSRRETFGGKAIEALVRSAHLYLMVLLPVDHIAVSFERNEFRHSIRLRVCSCTFSGNFSRT